MLIPKKFSLGGVEWTVLYDDEIDLYGDNGQCHSDHNVIKLASKTSNVSLSEKAIEENFIHELLHAILKSFDLSIDFSKKEEEERFVKLITPRLHQALVTQT